MCDSHAQSAQQVPTDGWSMQIQKIESFILKLSADSPYLGDHSAAQTGGGYFVRTPWRSLYSPLYETVLVKITATDGTAGWGEALAPVGPEVVALIIERLLAP